MGFEQFLFFSEAPKVLSVSVHQIVKLFSNEQYFQAREVVNRLKRKYDGDIGVDLLLKNIDGSNKVYQANVDSIENHSFTLGPLNTSVIATSIITKAFRRSSLL